MEPVPTSTMQPASDHTWSNLTPAEEARYHLPPGGQWFQYPGSQDAMLNLYRAQGGIPIAWDSNSKKSAGSKMYGLYNGITKSQFMESLMDTDADKRNAYELIANDRPCRGYADIDYSGPPDPQHQTLKQIVAALDTRMRERYHLRAEIYACCSSREIPSKDGKDALVKHSYHIVIPNLIFERNFSQEIKSFFNFDTEERFKYTDSENKRKSMFDTKVYTNNRVLRLPYCCKRGGTTLLVPVNADGYDTEFAHLPAFDLDVVLNFFVSDPTIESDHKFVPMAAKPLQADKTASAKRQRTGQPQDAQSQAAAAPTKPFPVPIHVVTDLLRHAGDSVTNLTNIQYLEDDLEGNGYWKIQGDQRKQTRTCLVTPNTTHTSNNCLLFVDRFSGGFRVKLRCMSTECASKPKIVLGNITIDTQTYQWQTTLGPRFQPISAPEPIETEDAMQEDTPALGPVDQDQTMAIMDAAEPAMEITQGPSQQQQQRQPAEVAFGPDWDYDDPDLNTFDNIKREIEKECFKCDNPFGYYIHRSIHPELLHHTHISIQHAYAHIHFYSRDKKTGELVKKPFIPAWQANPNIRVVANIVCDPLDTNDKNYNLWKGYRAATLTPVDPSLEAELVQPIVDHITKVITCGNEAHTQWILDYFANIVQRPANPTHVAILLYGTQGAGKGKVIQFMRERVLGEDSTNQSSNTEHDLFGRFSNLTVGRVLVQLDELDDVYKYTDRLKDYITGDLITYEKKGKDSIKVKNLANFLITSNNQNPIKISTDDRRMATFKCSDIYVKDYNYKVRFGAHLGRDEVARAMYQYLLKRDLSAYPYDFQQSRPVTDYYKESQMNSICLVARFLSALINDNSCGEPIAGKTLYDRYKNYAIAGGYKTFKTVSTFGTDLKRIPGVTAKRTSLGIMYTINAVVVKACLQETNQYDPEASWL